MPNGDYAAWKMNGENGAGCKNDSSVKCTFLPEGLFKKVSSKCDKDFEVVRA